MYHYSECGLSNVWLANGFEKIETPYGEAVRIDRVEDLHKAIARDLVRDRPHLTGAEFRFLRTQLDLSQKRLAEYFGYEPQSVALWEKRGKIPRWADHFIRALYREIAEGNAQIQQLIERQGDIDRGDIDKHGQARQEYEEHEGAWHTRAAA
jgi:DNA-binding transcriptional regulator YiaG